MMDGSFRRVFTAMLFFVWISYGFYQEIAGPLMFDLRMHLRTTSENIARSVSAQGIGIFLGALISGCSVDACGQWKFLLITIGALLASVTVVSMAFVNNLTVLWLTFFLMGTSAGLTNVAGQRIIFEMWKDEAPVPMHALHTGFGIGALAAPLIANPFLAVVDFDVPTTLLNSTNGTTNISISPTLNSYSVVKPSRVQIACLTLGIIITVFSVPFFIYPFVKCCRREKEESYANIDSENSAGDDKKLRCIDIINPATYAEGSFKYGLFMFILSGFYFYNVFGSGQLFGNFIRTFSVDELQFKRNEASYLDTVYWGLFTLGRVVGALLSNFMSIRTLFAMDIIFYVLFATLATVFAAETKGSLWAFSALIGFFIGPLHPAGVSFINTQIEVGGAVLSLILFASGLGQLSFVWIEGILYDRYGPRTVLYALQGSAVFIAVIMFIFVIVSSRRVDRFTRLTDSMLGKSFEMQETKSYTKLNQTPKIPDDG